MDATEIVAATDSGLSQTAQKLRRLHDVTRQMMRAETKQTLFDTVTETASELLGFEFNTVRRYDEDRNQLIPVAVSPSLRQDVGDRRPYDAGETVHWQAMKENQILAFQNVVEIDDDADRTGDGSMLVVPLGEFGVLSLGSPDPQTLTEADVHLAMVFGANVETAIARITHLQALNDQQARLNRQAQQITVLNRALRHNIRNELTKLTGFQVELRDQVSGDELSYVQQSLSCIEEVGSLAERARGIQELLSGAQDRSRVDLVGVVNTQVEQLQDTYDSVAVDTTVQASAAVSASDNIQDGIWEVLDNAVVHNESATPTIDIRLDRVSRDGKPFQQLTISDDGPGIPQQEREVIYAASEHKLKHSNGLGLWYVKWLVDRSAGSLRFVESAIPDANGTGVQIELPISGS